MTWVSLARLLGPVTAETFFGQTWGQAPRLFRGGVAREAPAILDLGELEQLLATAHGAANGWLHLASGGKQALPPEMVDEEGMLDLAQVRGALAAGNSLYLTKAERLSTSLMAMCRAVELDLAAAGVTLRRSVNAHVFLTPSASRAFVAHRDEHASFVVQLDGTKEWALYELPPTQRCPGPVSPQDLEGCSPASFYLEPGDVLYMPEWWAHEARTSGSYSLHVTMRVFPLRWSDLLRDIADADPDMSDALPFGLANDADRLSDALFERLALTPVREKAPAYIDAAVRRRRVPRVVLPDDGLRQALIAGPIEDDTILEKCAGVSCDVAVEGDELAVRFPGGTLRGPAALRAVFEFVAAAPTLRPADLPDVAAGVYDRLLVARRLVESGMLRVARPSSGLDLNGQ